MMRRIDLLPEAYVVRRRERRALTGVIVAGLVVLLLLIGWWILLGLQINDANDELADVRAENARIEARIAELQRFAQLDAEVRTKRAALQTVMAGDVDWPALLTELAMVIPGEVWLTSLNGSAGATEGAAPVGTETAEVDIRRPPAFGRIQFSGTSLSMPGVARWMIRLATVEEFAAIWLNSATAAEQTAGVTTVDFDSTLELSGRAASGRFQDTVQP